MSFYTQHRNKKILNRLKILFVVMFMSILFFNIVEAKAGEMKNPNAPVWMTIDGDRVQIPVGVAEKIVKETQTTEEALAKKKRIITQHASVDVNDTSWILEAPSF